MSYYHPVLKWRKRELSALANLLPCDRTNVVPLLELPPVPWDFDVGRPVNNLTSLFNGWGTQLAAAWGHRRCAIDIPCEWDEWSGLSTVVLDAVFEQARVSGCGAYPVLGLDRSAAFLQSVGRILSADGRGLCIRLRAGDLSSDSVDALPQLLDAVDVRPEQCDVVLDFEADVHVSAVAFAEDCLAALSRIPFTQRWRSVVLCASSMPPALPFDMYWPHGWVPRREWEGYLCAQQLLQRSGLTVSYGDYAVQHPSAERVDPRLVGRDLTLVYAVSDRWLIFAGNNRSAHGIREIAVQWQRYRPLGGSDNEIDARCWADDKITQVAMSDVTEPLLETWSQVATNRHISVVSRQLRRNRLRDMHVSGDERDLVEAGRWLAKAPTPCRSR